MRRCNRLGSSSAIRHAYASGSRARARGAAFAGYLCDDQVEPRIAVVASRKVGPAVERNRARRRLRSAVDPMVSSLRPGAVVVLTATPDTNLVAFHELEASVARVLERGGAMNA